MQRLWYTIRLGYIWLSLNDQVRPRSRKPFGNNGSKDWTPVPVLVVTFGLICETVCMVFRFARTRLISGGVSILSGHPTCTGDDPFLGRIGREVKYVQFHIVPGQRLVAGVNRRECCIGKY
jgi:hypothetical protein